MEVHDFRVCVFTNVYSKKKKKTTYSKHGRNNQKIKKLKYTTGIGLLTCWRGMVKGRGRADKKIEGVGHDSETR